VTAALDPDLTAVVRELMDRSPGLTVEQVAADIAARMSPQELRSAVAAILRPAVLSALDAAGREPVYTPEEAGPLLRMQPWTVRRRCADGTLRARNTSPGSPAQGCWRITQSAIDAYNACADNWAVSR
jgi:hypothetical protein